jgi:hypothetical protein
MVLPTSVIPAPAGISCRKPNLEQTMAPAVVTVTL